MKKPLLISNPKYFKLLKKYRNLYARLKNMFRDGSYYNLEERARKSLFKKFKLLYQRLGKMQMAMGVKTAGIAMAFMLVSNIVDAQMPQQWVENEMGTTVFNTGINNGSNNIAKFVDIDNDGDEDLFLGGAVINEGGKPPAPETYTYKFYENKGIASEELFVDADNPTDPILPINSTHYKPSFIDFIDNDGDGDLDIYATNPENYGTVNFYKNVGTLSSPKFELTTGTENKFESLNNIFSVGFEDIDGDDDLDAVFNHSCGTFLFYKNDAGVFTEQLSSDNPFNGLSLYESVFDFLDLDGDDDIDAIAKSCGSLVYLQQNQSGTNSVFSINSCDNPIDNGYKNGVYPSFADLDEDDDMDLIVSDYDNSQIDLTYHENNNNEFTNLGVPALINTPISMNIYQNPKFIDIDGDGDLDLYIDSKYQYFGADKIYENVGDNETPLMELSILDDFGLPNEFYASTEAFVDIDNDGDLDMFNLEYYENATFYKNVGTTSSPDFQLQDQSNNPLADVYGNGYINSLAFADLDGDGDFDAVLAGMYDDPFLKIYKNTGTKEAATFVEVSYSENPFEGSHMPFNLEFADFDDDGDQDLIYGTYDYSKGTNAFLLFDNISDASNINFEAVIGETNPLDTFNIAYGNFGFTNLFNEDEISIVIRELEDTPIKGMPNFDITRYYTLKDLLSIDDKTYAIDENSSAGTVIGTIESEYYGEGTLTYSIDAGNTDDAFELSGNQILVKTESVLDYEIEANRTFTLTISATDETYTVDASYTINLNDLTETGINNQVKDNMKVYPNPASNELNVVVSDEFSGDIQLRLINSVGNIVKEKSIENNSECKLDVSDLNKGFYFLQVKSEGKTVTKKVIIK